MENLIAEVREKVLMKMNDPNEPFEYDVRDIERIKSNYIFIKRFILEAQSDGKKEAELIDLVTNQLIASLKWRKENNINEHSANHIPREFFEIGQGLQGRDRKTGEFIAFNRPLVNKKLPALNELCMQTALYMYEAQQDDIIEATVVIDASSFTWNSFDKSTHDRMTKIVYNNYPSYYTKIQMYGIPWFLLPFFRLVVRALPTKIRNRVSAITELPELDLLNGDGQFPAPEGCSDLRSLLIKAGESEEVIEKTMLYVEGLKTRYLAENEEQFGIKPKLSESQKKASLLSNGSLTSLL